MKAGDISAARRTQAAIEEAGEPENKENGGPDKTT